MKIRMLAVAAAGAVLVTGAGMACAKDVAVSLTGDQEVPAVQTEAKGAGKITIADDKSVTGSIKTTGITGTAAHIHDVLSRFPEEERAAMADEAKQIHVDCEFCSRRFSMGLDDFA